MEEKQDPFDGEYIGNIFGRKITIISAIVVIFFTAVVVYRHWALDVPPGLILEEDMPDEVTTDTIQ